MPVFKGAMKIARQNLILIFMYVGIIALSLILTIGNNANSQDAAYAAVSMDISFVDEDESPLSQALARHLAGVHTLKECENDSAALLEDLYYRESDFVLRIPQGFGADPEAHPLLVTEVPGSYTGVYLENQIESYLNQIELYEIAGFSAEEAISMADGAPAPAVTVLEQSRQEGLNVGPFFQFLPYGAICMLSFVIGNVLCAFTKTQVRKRTGASSFTHRRMEWELLLAVAVFGVLIFLIFLIFLVMGTLFYGSPFWSASHLGLHLINLAAMILVSMSLAYLIAMVANTQESLSGIVNSLSLGMSFFCGVFVPLELLGEGVKAVAHFLPFFWYEQSNDLLARFPVLSQAQMGDFRVSLCIQAAFALAFISLGAAIHKKRSC